jgi:chromosome segregation ATPase
VSNADLNEGTEQKLKKFAITDAKIEEIKAECMSLTVADVNDAEGYEKCKRARIAVRDRRNDVERVRKLLKKDALEYGRKVDGEAKRITALLTPIEEHLKAQEKIVTDEKARIKEEARLAKEAEERAAKEAEEARIKAEQEAAQKRIDEERAKLEAEKAKVKAEQEKIEAARRAAQAEEDAKRQAEADKLAAEKAKIEAERKALEEEKEARRRAEELEKARQEAAAKARQEAEEAHARELQEEYEAKQREEAEQARLEAMKPDKEKLTRFVKAVRAFSMPVCSEKVFDVVVEFKEILEDAASKMEAIIESL